VDPVNRFLVFAIDDAASASASLKHQLPGSGKQAQKQGELWAQSAGATLDNTVRDLDNEVRAGHTL
jgi:hypothetical protein